MSDHDATEMGMEEPASASGREPVHARRSSPFEPSASALQIMTTEHFTLQSARGAATSESSSRSALFLTVLSAALVALALAAQAVTPRAELFLALLALAVVVFLGLVTYMRVLENGIEDYLYVKEMNRIRHFYVEVAPEIAPYLILSSYDDEQGILGSMGLGRSRWRSLLTTASSVAIVTSVVGGVLVALALQLFSRPASAVTILTGLVTAAALALAFLRHGTNRWRSVEVNYPPLFPRSPEAPAA
jgi:hypothetical protein